MLGGVSSLGGGVQLARLIMARGSDNKLHNMSTAGVAGSALQMKREISLDEGRPREQRLAEAGPTRGAGSIRRHRTVGKFRG